MRLLNAIAETYKPQINAVLYFPSGQQKNQNGRYADLYYQGYMQINLTNQPGP